MPSLCSCQSSVFSRPGTTGAGELMPWRVAFHLTIALPSWVAGPPWFMLSVLPRALTLQELQRYLLRYPEARIRPLPDGLPEPDLRLTTRRYEPAGLRIGSKRHGALAVVGYLGSGVWVCRLRRSNG